MNVNHLPKLEMYLLGAPQIRANGIASMERVSTKAQALLYYLAMTGRTHARVALASLLWSEHGEGEARRNLRKVIQQLRAHFDPYLAIDHQTLGFSAMQAYWTDAGEFATQLSQMRHADPASLHAAIAVYRADFLEGFYVRDAPAFETWMLGERARLRQLMLQGLDTLAGHYASQGDLPQAIVWTRRLLELEPWREEIHRRLMMWLVQNGQRNTALIQYELCCRALMAELAVEPSQATRQLYTQILQQDAPVSTGQTPPLTVIEYTLVGRQTAWATLRAAWPTAIQRGPHWVWITGEAGIGKTRLAEELLLHVQRQGHVTARSRAYALEGRLAYAPLADWLRTAPLQGKLAKLNPVWRSEITLLLPELLIQQPDLPAPQPLTHRWQQKRLFEALLHAFTDEHQPLLLLLDDLQWCDPETLAWLHYLLDTVPQTPLLIVGTVRSDEVTEEHPLHKLKRMLLRVGKLTTIDLTPLSAEETAALGAQVTKHGLDRQTTMQLYQATAGNPLFVIESVRAGDKFGMTSDDTVFGAGYEDILATLPPKVYAVIEARLAQLSSTARTLAQWAATIGHAFTVALLVAASQQAEETVVQGLDELWQRHIVREQGNAQYDFSHDRIRDVAYAECGPVKRQLFHQRVARALETLHADQLDPVAGELAGHYQRAGALEQAFLYFRQAATVAKRLYAHSEVVDYLQKTIAIAQLLPPTPTTAEGQIDLWLELGLAQAIVHDWCSEQVATAWHQADNLAAQIDNPSKRCGVISSLASVYRNRGQWSKALELSKLGLLLAEKSGSPLLLDHAFVNYGVSLSHCGELTRALQYFKRNPALTDAPTRLTWGEGLASGLFVRSAKCLWLLGFPGQALARGQKVLELRHHHIDFMSHFPALAFAGMLYAFLRDAPTVQLLGQELIEISIKYDFPFFVAAGQMLTGWALAQQGDVQTGLLLLQQGIENDRKRNSRMFEPFWRALLVETLALAGKVEEALEEVTATLAYGEESGNCYWNAHLLKLKGDLLQELAVSAEEVEVWYQRAIATARHQEARSLELRATVSLCRLWQGLGQHAAAHRRLTEIYSWFTEGFATADLIEAQALLDEL